MTHSEALEKALAEMIADYRAMQLAPAYEVHNPSFKDMPLTQQIDAGINDWVAEGTSGHPYFGRSKDEAERIRASFGGK